MQGMLSER